MFKTTTDRRRAFARLVILCAATSAAARGARAQTAYKIDETDYTRCDLSEVAPVSVSSAPVFEALAKDAGAKVALVVHADRPGEALRYARHVGRRLTERVGVAPGRLSEVYGGYAGKKRVELWLVPAGAEPPRGAPAVSGEGVQLFDAFNYWGGESCAYEREDALKVFAETLKRLPGWRGTLVVRPHVNRRGLKPSDEGWDEASLNRRQAARRAAGDRLHLVRQLGLPPERIRAVVGASTEELSHAELWLVPPAARGEGFHLDFR